MCVCVCEREREGVRVSEGVCVNVCVRESNRVLLFHRPFLHLFSIELPSLKRPFSRTISVLTQYYISTNSVIAQY